MLKIALPSVAIAFMLASGTTFGQQHDLSELLSELFMTADEAKFALILPKLKEQSEKVLPILIDEINQTLPQDANDFSKEKLAKRKANSAVALMKLDHPDEVWPLLKHSPDPRVRSYIIHRLGPLGVNPKLIIKRLEVEQDITIRRALLLSLGEFKEQALSMDDRTVLLPKLQEMFRSDPDPGLHAAAEWLLRTWKQGDWINQLNQEWSKDKDWREKKLEGTQTFPSKGKEEAPPKWYVNSQGQTMVVIRPVEFMMGSPKEEDGRSENEPQHQIRIDRYFAIASKEVTVEQFRSHKAHADFNHFAPTVDCPVSTVAWFEAIAYCNWLSEQEEIPKDQWCYEPNKDGKYEVGMAMAPNYLQRSGYRLPTEAEWEYACRASAVTRNSFGESEGLLDRYAWFFDNSLVKSHPVGSLKPNDLGLFDMHGNTWEWCQDVYRQYGNEGEHLRVAPGISRVLRGGSFPNRSLNLRSSRRYHQPPTHRSGDIGFRMARTIETFPKE